ncbi:Gfo/Idh/MocA family oxidoreductase [Stigmatella sp. ncwal1]|uniref:Gfo/Idh/MocA family oxidoreductase n=1 Tax=Stigmatella ashevillensis TaxID=2995309 RepID=A0ABT5DAE5_9BACT|nr:Gfo/Idh/MocA family oxidoreductase [Stigmatella ashevillena]MDC0710618.1 Gfo/Idh/MocA family oxidoreductase [Stigmatella ashevillena]
MTAKRIRVGIIGTGFAQSTQVPAFQACSGVEVVSIASSRVERAEAVARDLGIAHGAGDWREVVDNPQVDLVSIVTPPHLHHAMSLAALQAGKAVLCEKPTALDAAEAEIMWLAAEQRGTLALLDHELRFLPSRQRMRELVQAGELGTLYHARVFYRSDHRAGPERTWDWWSDMSRGGGLLGAMGSHAVDSLRFVLGREPVEVMGMMSTHVTSRMDEQTHESRLVTSDDEIQALMGFGGELTAAVSLSAVEPGEPLHGMEVYGSKGGLRVVGEALWRSTVGSRQWEPVVLPAQESLPEGMPDNEWARGFLRYARALTETLDRGARALPGAATFEDGWRNMRVLDAVRRSHSERRWVSISSR